MKNLDWLIGYINMKIKKVQKEAVPETVVRECVNETIANTSDIPHIRINTDRSLTLIIKEEI